MSQRPVPPRGMRDLLPTEVRVRHHLLGRLLATYERHGFDQVETPALEEIERLVGSEGGDNEKLMYKVLRRGLSFDQPAKSITSEDELVDLGLRYDLTVPLARFYATHSAELPFPFRAIQFGSAWRAERPQKGRYRQFTQCDIDTVGDPTTNAEIELIVATAEALQATEVGDFLFRLNDRRLVDALVLWAGFTEVQRPAVLVIIDKLDKIELAGVHKELSTIAQSPATKLADVLGQVLELSTFDELAAALPVDSALDDMRHIVTSVATVLPWLSVRFDPTLVRGQGYYTGAIFEIEQPDSAGSLGGGGRYDGMIGKFLGQSVPACGFSIGFERLVSLLIDKSFDVGQRRVVLLHAANAPFVEVIQTAQQLRDQGAVVRPETAVKNRGAQLARLSKFGFTHWAEHKPGIDVTEINVQTLTTSPSFSLSPEAQ